VSPSHLVIAPHQPSDNTSDWNSVFAELHTKLPGEIVAIESPRIRVEAVIAELDIGNVLRHLTISARTPAQKEIVRYELDTITSGSLASNLAAVLFRAQDRATPAEKVVEAISECLHRWEHVTMKKIVAEPNPWVQLSMGRLVPDFEEFARNPLSIDMTFALDRRSEDTEVRAVARLFPERGYTVVQSSSSLVHDTSLSPSHTFKVRCAPEFWNKSKPQEEVIYALHVATCKAMDTILIAGPTEAAKIFGDSGIDARLEKGIVEPSTCHILHVLPSGARVMLEEGDSVACVRIEASSSQESASAFWRITAPDGLLLPDDPRLITANSAVGSLIEGDPRRRLEAIKTLDRIANADSDKLSAEGRRVTPFSTISAEELLGEELRESLSRYRRVTVKTLAPSSDLAILDLLDGFQSVSICHRDLAHTQMNPQDPDYLVLGFRGDGSLKITLKNPLRNYLDIVVSPDYFDEVESREDCVMRLAHMFDEQTRASLLALRAEIEDLARRGSREIAASRALRPPGARFPSVQDRALNKALDTAADIALFYEVDAPGSVSDLQVLFPHTTMCEMVIANSRVTPNLKMHMLISSSGISGIDLYVNESAMPKRYPFSFLTPISKLEGRQVITSIFKLFLSAGDDASRSSRVLASPFAEAPLFKYLRECVDRFAVLP
jgi:hypothetical protein